MQGNILQLFCSLLCCCPRNQVQGVNLIKQVNLLQFCNCTSWSVHMAGLAPSENLLYHSHPAGTVERPLNLHLQMHSSFSDSICVSSKCCIPLHHTCYPGLHATTPIICFAFVAAFLHLQHLSSSCLHMELMEHSALTASAPRGIGLDYTTSRIATASWLSMSACCNPNPTGGPETFHPITHEGLELPAPLAQPRPLCF
jgi:hypothetical protein